MDENTRDALTRLTFRGVKVVTGTSNRLHLPVISTGRPFAFYREVFFGKRTEDRVLAELRGKVILDVGCGLTPHTRDSMFQACHRAGIEFYGVDPKLADRFEFGPFDRLKVLATGGRGVDPDAPGASRRLAAFADDLPFEDASVDLILSSWALFVWIADPDVLAGAFTEFRRVLKSGGEVKVYPTPELDEVRRRLSKAECLDDFALRQVFLGKFSLHNLPPAYRTTFRRV